ncbi:NAD(P)/FAD-dependent oxidoreductase [Selenomonadales bacterium OttesenSCG-928-I06]|nr:NAD(P)/FAD-dependent oxidoreductase [Selenomonadales bacterium OttesenSCG-928-I06]
MLKISNFRVPLIEETPVFELANKYLKISKDNLIDINILHYSIDARRKNNISFVYTLAVEADLSHKAVSGILNRDRNISVIVPEEKTDIILGSKNLSLRPVVIGLGPAGLLLSYTLAKHGYRPLILERGKDVKNRTLDVQKFWQEGFLNENSNVQFGEGGAGAFSDGKLTTRVNNILIKDILDILIAAGAPTEIKYLNKPHIGTDVLKKVVENIRKEIISWGGEIRFNSALTDIEIKDKSIVKVQVNDDYEIECDNLFLAIGHSARDTYEMIYRKNLAMESKAFAIGVRIEHPQALIDEAQYGSFAGHEKLKAADYTLTFQDKSTNRAAYSFCMCPGGSVIASSSEKESVVVNGMSLYKRNSGIANSALVVNVNPADFGDKPLDGINYQRFYEKAAYNLGDSNYSAPVMAVGDFLNGSLKTDSFLLEPSYKPAVKVNDINLCLPKYVTDTLKKAIVVFGKKIKGFDHPKVPLLGVETRTSAPVRILRDDNYQSVNINGIYPVGEGAGYAGGIISAALDGYKVALSFISRYKPF